MIPGGGTVQYCKATFNNGDGNPPEKAPVDGPASPGGSSHGKGRKLDHFDRESAGCPLNCVWGIAGVIIGAPMAYDCNLAICN